ncbi:MAG: HAMP domain-containing protein [Chitinophagaceae bacterium]|nr:HAMP domain-containing protein [Chitinophagaceae bacterium]
MKLKTKLSLGMGFLFAVILIFGILGIFYITRLKDDATRIIENNHESLVYTNHMERALNSLQTSNNALTEFEKYLKKQEKNITEIGEKEQTENLRRNFELLKTDKQNGSTILEIRTNLIAVSEINQNAILRKNEIAQHTADNAIVLLTILFTILTLITFSFVINFPDIISTPVRALAEGISAIANKQYDERIHIDQKDEFGDLANAFNSMAEKLDAYEHSNLARITFEKSRIETIINQMKDGIVGLDEKRNILFLNVVAENLLGLKEKEIIGKYAPDIALKNDLMRKLLLSETDHKELKIYADNKESYFNKDVFLVMNEDVIIGQVVVLRNITPFHELNEAKTNFIATVSHELKTPLASIKMSAKLLTNEKVGEFNSDQKDLIHSIVEDADRLLKITGELLNMSQVETGNIQLKLQSVSPIEIVENAVQTVLFQAQQKGIEIRLSSMEGLPNIYADKEKAAWVLINLLTNAIKYSYENTKIDLGIIQQKKHLEFFVKDYGYGIEEKYLPKIFDRYFKVPGTHERSGTGLGLAISKEFIEAQQGCLTVSSNLGEGSRFSFSLPLF